MSPAAPAIVTALAELSSFFTVYCRPVMPLALGSVTVNATEEASARRTGAVDAPLVA